MAVLPLFAEGALSPADAVLDAVVAVVLVRLLGWHWAFLPTLMIEALPGADLFPTWTAAVFFVTRQSHHPGEPVILPPEHSNAHGRKHGRNTLSSQLATKPDDALRNQCAHIDF